MGETGTGKTTVCQRLAQQLGRPLHIVNCNQHTEAADLLGGYRPSRWASPGLSKDCVCCVTVCSWSHEGLPRHMSCGAYACFKSSAGVQGNVLNIATRGYGTGLTCLMPGLLLSSVMLHHALIECMTLVSMPHAAL